MKQAQLKQLIAEAIEKTGYLFKDYVNDLADAISNEIAEKLFLERIIIVSGKIDDCPSHYIVTEKEFRNYNGYNGFRKIKDNENIEQYREAYNDWFYKKGQTDPDGFDKADHFELEKICIIEDYEKYQQIKKLMLTIPHCKTRKEAEKLQEKIHKIEQTL